MQLREQSERVDALRSRLATVQSEFVQCLEELFQLLDSMVDRSGGGHSTQCEFGWESPNTSQPVIDMSTLTVRWQGQTCRMDPGIPARILDRLLRKPGAMVSYDELMDSVWCGEIRSHATLRSEMSRIRQHLRSAGMDDLANAIRGRNRHYVVLLDRRQ